LANGGVALSNPYVATGGTSQAAHYALVGGVDAHTFGSGGTGTGSGSGTTATTKSTTASGTHISPASSTGGNYTFSWYPSGGGNPMVLHEKLTIGNTLGSHLIGGNAIYNVTASAGTLSNITWSYSGSTPLYSSVHVPNPSAGETSFVRNPYDISSAHSDMINFNWGEIPGSGSITVSADVSMTVPTTPPSIQTHHATAIMAANVVAPQFTVSQTAHTKTKSLVSGGATWITYGWPGPGIMPGIQWTASSTTGGQIAIVQIVNGGANSQVVNGVTLQTYIHRSPAGVVTNAPFPLWDGPTATTPWYSTPSNPNVGQDSPGFPITTATTAIFSVNITDYVMYNPGGAWVPEAQFSWNVNATASYGWWSGWTITDVTPPYAEKPFIAHTWPPTWGDLVTNWNTFI
jgi:hypothetical protein